jgi:hypothetical protein
MPFQRAHYSDFLLLLLLLVPLLLCSSQVECPLWRTEIWDVGHIGFSCRQFPSGRGIGGYRRIGKVYGLEMLRLVHPRRHWLIMSGNECPVIALERAWRDHTSIRSINSHVRDLALRRSLDAKGVAA